MGNAVKIDPLAFGRGVDEVLLLKPVRRAVHAVVASASSSAKVSPSKGKGSVTSGVVVRGHSKDDNPSG